MNTFICFLLLSFKLIPANYQNADSLISKLKPNDTIQDWEYLECNVDGEGMMDFRLIYSNNKPFDFKPKFLYNFDLPNVYSRASRVILYKTSEGKTISVDTIDKLKFFLGQIDNLEEAIFLARLYGYGFYSNSKKYGSYTENEEGFLLNGFKESNVPDVIDVEAPIIYYRIFVERNGNVIIKNPIPTP